MGLLDRHVSVLKSEEFVLGMSAGWKGEDKQAGMESTKICIVATPSAKNWTGFTSVDQKIADASVGASMVGKVFPARCLVSYKRVTSTVKSTFDGRESSKDIEQLLVVGIEYIAPVDLVDIKVAKAA
ncbi:MAG: hypothetical protein FD157_3516 [Rhodocyclaceae bacterium]|nr:MAG: hypothetical protein FD157_3516 [Rhodocyclaceae bacterium]TND01871.1 MAG: hypothetical protein FD118_2130 [Rhodocyclaceae bacterium]